MSLLTRLFLLVLLAVLPAIGIEAYSQIELRRIREAQVHEEALRLARLADAEMDRIAVGARQLLVAFAENPSIAAQDWRGCNAAAARLLSRLTGYVNIGVATAGGDIVCSARPQRDGANISALPAVARVAAADDFAIGVFGVSRLGGARILPFVEPLRAAGGGRIGVVWASLDLDWLARHFAGRFPGPDVTLTVADRDGTVLLRLPDNEKWGGQKLDAKYLPELNGAADGTVETAGMDGVVRIIGYSPVTMAPAGIYVGVGLTKATVFAAVDRATLRGAVLVALCVGLALAAAWAGGTIFLRRPVRALLGAAERWRRGDYGARSDLTDRRTEMGQLGRAFDEMAAEIEEREGESKRADAELRRLNESLEERVEARTRERDRIWRVSEDLLGVGNFDGYFLGFNPAWTRVLGWSEDEIKRLHVNELRHPDDAAVALEGRERLAAGVPTVRMENRFRRKDGAYRWISWTMTAEHGLIYVIGRDVTAEKEAAATLWRAEEQLRQAQKMEALGQLTGGIAHDFNNLLTIILGNLEAIERAAAAGGDKVRKAAAAAIRGVQRAANLTQRLLAYAQKQPLNPRTVDINQLIAGLGDLIRQTHGEDIRCDYSFAADLGTCFCDTNQLETTLLNLIINARDAMPRGGALRIATALRALDAATARAKGLSPGPHVVLAVADDGVGMSPQIRAAAFEPFFTTKEPGKGTGLGLSMVYGFVKQSHGHIEIDSDIGRGTTVTIFLPQAAPAAREIGEPPAAAARRSGAAGKTVLLVEDDDSVRSVVAGMLESLECRVLEAGNADAALALARRAETPIDLLLTDVVLPGMNGRALAQEVKAIRPSIKVLFITGYARDVIVHQGRLEPGIDLIEKPFTRDVLAARICPLLAEAEPIPPEAAAAARN